MTAPTPLTCVPDAIPPAPPVRVLYLIDSLGRGGAEHLLAESLPHLQREGVVPSVIALQEREGNPLAARIAAAGVPVAHLDILRLRQRGAYAQVRRAIAAAAPDVVHTQLEFAAILGLTAARRMGLPPEAGWLSTSVSWPGPCAGRLAGSSPSPTPPASTTWSGLGCGQNG
jgi:hypothetical protein